MKYLICCHSYVLLCQFIIILIRIHGFRIDASGFRKRAINHSLMTKMLILSTRGSQKMHNTMGTPPCTFRQSSWHGAMRSISNCFQIKGGHSGPNQGVRLAWLHHQSLHHPYNPKHYHHKPRMHHHQLSHLHHHKKIMTIIVRSPSVWIYLGF